MAQVKPPVRTCEKCASWSGTGGSLNYKVEKANKTDLPIIERMRIDNLSKLSRLFWINITKLSITIITIFNHIINTVYLLVYSHINLHSLVKMGNRRLFVLSYTQSTEQTSSVVQEGKTVEHQIHRLNNLQSSSKAADKSSSGQRDMGAAGSGSGGMWSSSLLACGRFQSSAMEINPSRRVAYA